MKVFIPIFTIIFFGALSYAGYVAFYGGAQDGAAPSAEPIKAEILSDDPSAFTIDVEFLANADANTEAEFFAVYVSEDKPADCADFSDTELSYDKPEEHKRRFDLSDHEDIIEAIESKHCVIIPNTPA